MFSLNPLLQAPVVELDFDDFVETNVIEEYDPLCKSKVGKICNDCCKCLCTP